VKLGKKRRESSKRNYYIIFLSLIITAIIITLEILHHGDPTRGSALVVSCSSHSATDNNKCLISSETKLELQEPPARSRGFEPLGAKRPDCITTLSPRGQGVHAAWEYQGSTRSKCSLGTSRCDGHFRFQARKDAVWWASTARQRTTIMMDANHGDLVKPVGRRSQCCRDTNETHSWDFLAGSQPYVVGSSIASTGTCGSWWPVARTRNTTHPKVQQRQTSTDRQTWIVCHNSPGREIWCGIEHLFVEKLSRLTNIPKYPEIHSPTRYSNLVFKISWLTPHKRFIRSHKLIREQCMVKIWFQHWSRLLPTVLYAVSMSVAFLTVRELSMSSRRLPLEKITSFYGGCHIFVSSSVAALAQDPLVTEVGVSNLLHSFLDWLKALFPVLGLYFVGSQSLLLFDTESSTVPQHLFGFLSSCCYLLF